jgi:hypothetical protein
MAIPVAPPSYMQYATAHLCSDLKPHCGWGKVSTTLTATYMLHQATMHTCAAAIKHKSHTFDLQSQRY